MFEGGKILDIHGHRWGAHRTLPHYTVKFEDEGVFAVYYKGVFGDFKKIYWAPLARLEFGFGLVNEQSGGGWVGGGFGLGGAVKGAIHAAALNALTTRNREYAVLMVIEHDASGAEKTVSIGFRNIDEAALRNKVAQAIPVCADPSVKKLEDTLRDDLKSGDYKKDEAIELVDNIKTRLERGTLSMEQGDRLFVFLEDMVPEAFPKPISQATSVTRVEQLKTLSDLRNSGALSEAEFEAEKQLLLAGSRS